MKKIVSVLCALVLVTGVLVAPASAWRGHGFHHGGGCFGCGFGFGFFSGAVVGGALAAPYYYAPYPYYAAPPVYSAPQPSCYTQPGYWQQVPVPTGGGYTTYQNAWVPPQTVCR